MGGAPFVGQDPAEHDRREREVGDLLAGHHREERVEAVGDDQPAAGAQPAAEDLAELDLSVEDSAGTDPGEIVVRGANLFSGYWPDGAGHPGPDGWFATGDIGYLRDGELFLVDRTRELISVSGFPVYPAEVEEAILELPAVESVAVLGRPDPRTGSEVVAFVTGRALTEEMVAAHCAARLARFKRPTTIAVVDALPRGATGQVRKGRLRGTLAEADR